MTYRLFKDDIVRTTPSGELGTYGLSRDVAFEVDHFDSALREGRSVLAVGRLEAVDDPSVVRLIQDSDDPQPWVSAPQPVHAAGWRDLTGRRVRAPKEEASGR